MDDGSLSTPTGSGPAAAVLLLIALLGYLVFLEVASYVIARRAPYGVRCHSLHGDPA
jgi:hypothetical protein